MSAKLPQAEIGVIGGSGFYEFIDNGEKFDVPTDWAMASGMIIRRIKFLIRRILPLLKSWALNILSLLPAAVHYSQRLSREILLFAINLLTGLKAEKTPTLTAPRWRT